MTRIAISGTLAAVILAIGAFYPVATAGPLTGPCCAIEQNAINLPEAD